MNRSRKYWKSYAKKSLKRGIGTAMAGMLAVLAVNFIGNMLSLRLFPGTDLPAVILGQIFAFAFSLIAIVFRTGYDYMLLNQARGQKFSLGNLMYLFHNGPDRVLIAGFIVSLLNAVAQIPFYYTALTLDFGVTVEQQAQWAQSVMMMFILSLVLNVVITVPFALTFYLLADYPEMGGMEALKESARLMKGHIWKYWLMMLSFVPLLILSVFTVYIALLWVLPYMYMTQSVFYMDIQGEFAIEGQKEESTGDDTCRNDDYNSEA